MCVIIGIPKGKTITEEEITSAWIVNPHGAGYAIQTGKGTVKFKRGIMDLDNFIDEIKPLMGSANMYLHFRISTSDAVNEIQTHPYQIGRKESLSGETKSGITCMNGVISHQKEYKGYNDTMSYIHDHLEAFKILADTGSQDLLNIIESDTGSRWALITPTAFKFSKGFSKESNGCYYSNTNHIPDKKYINYTKKEVLDMLYTPLQKQLKKDNKTLTKLTAYVNKYPYMISAIYWLDTKKDIQDLLKGKYYY